MFFFIVPGSLTHRKLLDASWKVDLTLITEMENLEFQPASIHFSFPRDPGSMIPIFLFFRISLFPHIKRSVNTSTLGLPWPSQSPSCLPTVIPASAQASQFPPYLRCVNSALNDIPTPKRFIAFFGSCNSHSQSLQNMF